MTFDQKFEQTYVVVTDFNGWDQTQRCLQSLASSLPKQPHIIVVDHGTDGETSKQLHSCSGVSLVRGSSSDWWSGACNAGIEKALSLGAKYIVLLNNDCRVGQTTINSLLQSLHQTKRSDTTIIAAKQRVDGSSTDSPYLISTCLILGFNTLVLPQWLTRKSDKSETLVSVNMIIGGRGIVIPAGVFTSVGMFDNEELPHYCADHDFFLRCRKKGIRLYVHTGETVLVDQTNTSSAARLSNMSPKDFYRSLTSIRSHRNFRHLLNFYKKHYPLKPLYWVGASLNVMRYGSVYLMSRLR